jgi:hypothetical protein
MKFLLILGYLFSTTSIFACTDFSVKYLSQDGIVFSIDQVGCELINGQKTDGTPYLTGIVDDGTKAGITKVYNSHKFENEKWVITRTAYFVNEATTTKLYELKNMNSLDESKNLVIEYEDIDGSISKIIQKHIE